MDFSKAVLVNLGITPNLVHVGARRALVAWMGPESGWASPCDGFKGAKYNPLNTTLVLPLCSAPSQYNTNPGVQNYVSFVCGAAATAATLRESRYDALRAVLGRPFVTGKAVLRAVADSDWGTFHLGGSPDCMYADAIYDTYMANRVTYNQVSIGV